MKTFLTTLLMLLTVWVVPAQNGINFKALVTDADGNPLANQTINVMVEIQSGFNLLWSEEHTGVTTDNYGIFSIRIGEGNRTGGSVNQFDEMDWDQLEMMYSVSIDNGDGYTSLVENEPFSYMPYALQADKLADQYGITKYVGYDAGLRFKDRSTTVNHYDIHLDSLNGLAIGYNGNDLLTFQGSVKAIVHGQMSVAGTLSAAYAEIDNLVSAEVRVDKIKASETADADLKAYIYGNVAADGSILANASTSGFTVTKTGTGVYDVYFSNSPGDAHVYIVVAGLVGGTGAAFLNSYQSADHFTVYTFDASGSAADHPFNFVVYKK